MDVLIASPNVIMGDGQGRVNNKLAAYLAGSGHRVTILADRVDADLCEQDGVTWQRLEAHVRLPALPRGILWSRQATAWLADHAQRFDIVHLNGATAFAPHHVNTCHLVHGAFRQYLRAETRGGLRHRYHLLHSDINFRAERRAYALARRVVAVSHKTAAELEEALGIRQEKLNVIHNGVDSEAFGRDPSAHERVRNELHIPPDTFALLFVGDFVGPHKGLQTVIEALRGLPESIHLYVAGRGSPSAQMAGVDERVGARMHFLGFRTNLRDIYAAVDCFAYPTRYDSFGLVVLEALATGIPVITSRDAGASELIQSGRDGVLLDHPNDVSGLQRWILRLSRDRELAAEIGRHGRLVAEANSWSKMAMSYERLYEDVLRSGAS